MAAVKVDYNKCPDASGCLKCLGCCAVLTVYPEGKMFAEGAVLRINPTFISLCDGCGNCRSVCPAGAIAVNGH